MRIFFINNHGGGFADEITVESGTTIKQLFDKQMPHSPPQDYLIRVNRQPSQSEQILQEGDRVSITPVKIEGAQLRAA